MWQSQHTHLKQKRALRPFSFGILRNLCVSRQLSAQNTEYRFVSISSNHKFHTLNSISIVVIMPYTFYLSQSTSSIFGMADLQRSLRN